ncbi:aminodeoxychorismate synthase component 1 [Vibrio gazogenes]|uniref:aminodeoxychorismate synthase n=1 Tax=Vibrio gazogenes DSM 21264 = NBRC 103151 TaxID=1123492 RepID=A0A1M4Z9P3_VIBGA|nr:aminodeoxychorismate synthase component 1 [Vibrio gazogenes]USP12479.1 aminodeoxychorismate synthase component 1 [Vibrio gazogenes]SHF14695.1 aminodeoxychorismate synthase, subunit I [Vibrio gazogenes DSM 21264] [Vibrio gazogenes DSM 21264 = NBRC 103151]SJN53903.1 Aminodeoxychorismate synthase component 1 [Vibrio gazogenes]
MNNASDQYIEHKPLTYHPQLAIEYFSRIEHLPWSMLLRSPAEHTDSRYDILVAQPIVTLKTQGAETQIQTSDGHVSSPDDPFELLTRYQNQYAPALEKMSAYPFVGGALGYFAYDLGRRVEHLPEQAARDIPLPEMAVGIYTWALVVDHRQQTAALVGIGTDAAAQWLNAQQAVEQLPFRLTSDWQANMTEHEYRDRINAIHEYLHSGDCYQVNLTQRFQAGYTGSEWQAYQRLENENRAPFSAYLRIEEGVILSISPERFLQYKAPVIETKPIKGTMPRSADQALDRQHVQTLAASEKDQSENLMIVDLLRNDIGRVAKPGSVHVPTLFAIESFPAVHHLVSTIQAELDTHYTAADLLRACFPGGSITGAPKIRAMEIIEELEPQRRSVYCGSIGYISRDGQMDTSITIRTLTATNQQLYVWAGGGIVADSECASEYQETFDKLSRILPVLSS